MFTERDMRAAAKEMMARAANKLRVAGDSAHPAQPERRPVKSGEKERGAEVEGGHGAAPGSIPVAIL